jgi:hypothetical protein
LHMNGTVVGGSAPRASLLRRVLLSRAIPGGVAVVAALTVPEFSVGADDLDGDKRRSDPPEPFAKAGQGLRKSMPSAATAPLAGVRYGGLLAIRETSLSPSAGPVGDDVLSSPSQPLPEVAAAAVVPAIKPAAGVDVRSAPTNTLDDAVAFAASVIETIAVQPGPQAQITPDAPPPQLAKPAAIDMAASYAAMAIDRFVAGAASRVEQAAEWSPQAEQLPDLGLATQDEAALVLPVLPAGVTGDVGAASPLDLPDAVPQPMPVPEAARPLPLASIAAPLPAVPAGAVAPATVQPAPAPATVAAAAMPAPAVAALAALPTPRSAAPTSLGTSAPTADEVSAPLAFDLKSQLVTRVDGKTAGKVDFRQTATGLSVRLGSIVSVLSDRYDPGEVARITTSAASNAYVSLAELQAQGIPISYDPVYDEFNIGQTDTRPKAARKVHIDQISTPERGLGTAAIDQVRR